jgi:hypothetical protein
MGDLSLTESLGLIGIIIGILGGAAFALAYIRGSYNKVTIEALRADLEDYERRERLHEKEMVDCKRRIVALEEATTSRDQQIAVLREVATQKAAVDELARVVADRHTETMAKFDLLLEALGRLKP